jgi:predicted metal-dependent enzyme (double-stranded beta helix superfamily)
VIAAPAVAATSSAVRLELDVLADIVAGLARAEELWRPHVAHDPDDRVRRRLLATPAYEVWLLGWTPGQSVGLHDHGDANGAFVVVDGELTETSLVDGVLTLELLRAGQTGRVPVGALHDVANRSAHDATSIHAYSRPLRAMGFYGHDGSLDRVEAVHEQSTLLEAATLAATIGW